MKKTARLLLMLFVLASLIVVGRDRMLMHASADDGKKHGSDASDVSDPSETERNPEAPEEIASVIREELKLFPIPQSISHPDYRADFEDSWMSTRTFGGERGHEGTDIMLTPNERGLFPVLSMTDGIVEKKGWLPQGGYRLGIRSDGGIYYYYAHFYDYADDIEVGASVASGQLLGFAGDSGYSNIEGTVGNFPVHLHIGIYYNNEQGIETAVNPYPFLVPLEPLIMDY
ncbi:MAG: M23 family metallopeptidase [bacterium]|nr:M23 family metallopeptidase [bacterium]MDY4100298.1 M23 family metallopeptidase [Lachnospiraceae bacterium]